MTDIFISYAHDDEERVRPLVQELEQRGWSVFWDMHIPAGRTWHDYIAKALDDSRCVLVVWSRHSIGSDSVIEEALVGKKRGILVPLRLDAIDPPLGFGLFQAPNLSDWRNNSAYQPFQQLLGEIESRVSPSTLTVTVSPPPPKAKPDSVQGTAQTSGDIPPSSNTEQQSVKKRNDIRVAITGKQQMAIAFTFVMLFMIGVWMIFKPKPTQSPPVAVVGAVAPVAAVSVPPNFVLISGGEFIMGSPSSEAARENDEGPQHRVRLSDFYLCKYAVMVAEFRKFVEATGYRTDADKAGFSVILSGNDVKKGDGVNWRYGVSGSVRPFSEDNHPVVHVSWNDAVAYCKWLSKKTGKKFRLPTEAEREYACRAGTTTPFNTGENLTTAQANYDGNYPYTNNPKGEYRRNTVPVNSFAPNAWGLYTMHGNVWEWCSDWYGGNYYDECKAKGVVENPVGPETGSSRVLRGGSWYDYARNGRSAYRNHNTPDNRHDDIGFRLVCVP